MIKISLLLALAFIFNNNLIAQIDSTFDNKSKLKDKTEYVFNLKKSKINTLGIYFSPEAGLSYFNKNTAPSVGGSFMILLNKKIAVGFSGQITGKPNNNKEILNLGFGGVKLEYTIKPNSKVHASFPLIIGAGFANNDSIGHRYGSPNRSSKGSYGRDWNDRDVKNQYIIIQPGVNIEANLMRYLKIFGGFSYRKATKSENERYVNTTNIIKPSQVSGISATIGIKVGLFDFRLNKKDSLRKK